MIAQPPEHVLAQANIGRVIAPLTDPIMAGFVEQLPFINAVADKSPGFIWRLQTEDGDATAIRVFADERILLNLSVWDSIDSLHDYVYHSEHRAPLRNHRSWFERMDAPHFVLWWIRAHHRPSVEEAKERLEQLRRLGPTPEAFTFKNAFLPSGEPLAIRQTR